METKICGGRVKEWEASSKAKREGWRSANLATLLPAFFSSHVCVKSAEKISRFFSRTNIKRKANRPPQWEREWRERTSESSIEQNILCATRWGEKPRWRPQTLGGITVQKKNVLLNRSWKPIMVFRRFRYNFKRLCLPCIRAFRSSV